LPAASTTTAIAEFEYPREVHFVDTDATGFAHFSVYVRLSASLQVNQPLSLGQRVKVKLSLIEIDGKHIVYEFNIVEQNNDVAVEGRFRVACCRFPDGELPYAILTPQFIMDALEGET